MKQVILLGGFPTPGIPLGPHTEGEVWGCNSLWKLAEDTAGHFRATRWFELHPLWTNTPEEQQAVIECPVPIYVLDAAEWPTAKRAVTYPLEAVANPNRYFCSTFAYQMALAIHEGFTEIGLLGIDLTCGTRRERIYERANLEWWIGYAEGRGITGWAPTECGMASHPYLYGYDYDAERKWVDTWTDAIGYTPDSRGRIAGGNEQAKWRQ